MSQSLNYVACDVTATFKTRQDMDERVLAFLRDTTEWDESCYEEEGDEYPVCARVFRKDEELKAHIYVESYGDTYIDINKLVEFICRHFPTAEGNIGYADANGGNIEIENGKVKK